MATIKRETFIPFESPLLQEEEPKLTPPETLSSEKEKETGFVPLRSLFPEKKELKFVPLESLLPRKEETGFVPLRSLFPEAKLIPFKPGMEGNFIPYEALEDTIFVLPRQKSN